MKKKKISAAVVGLGFGNVHLQTLIQSNLFSKIFLCDLKKKFKETAKKLNLNFIDTFKDLLQLKNIKLICIASYDNYHAEQVISSLKKNINVLVEKPMCQTFFQLKKIKNIIKFSKAKLICNFVLRYHPKFLKVYKLINSYKIGKIYYIEAEYNYGRLKKLLYGWRAKIPFYSVIQGGAIHMIDLVLWLSKSIPSEVIATGNKIVTNKTKFKFLDNVVSIIKFKNGLNAKITSNFGCVMPHDHTLKVYGTKGTIIVRNNIVELFKNKNKKINQKVYSFNNVKKSYKQKLLKNFLSLVIRNKKKSNISLNEIFLSMATCLCIEKSIKTLKWEKIKI